MLKLEGGGLNNIIKAINFLTWASSFGYKHSISNNKAIWTCNSCPPQEQRVKMGKGEFPCRPTFDACFNNVIEVIDPRVRVQCIFCPPGPHPDDAWCQREFIAPGNRARINGNQNHCFFVDTQSLKENAKDQLGITEENTFVSINGNTISQELLAASINFAKEPISGNWRKEGIMARNLIELQ